jgi:hypothetical protein
LKAKNHVHDALRRWERDGLIDAQLAHRLGSEVDAHVAGEGRRWAQYAIAATGAVILVIAAGVFLRWAWPLMGPASHSILLACVGVGVLAFGMVTESSERMAPAAYLLQSAGLALLLMSFIYSGRAWSDSSPGAIVFGIAIIAVPLVTAGLAIRRNPVMPAIHTAFGYAFLYTFLERATPLDDTSILWILDGVAVLATVLLALRLGRAEHQEPDDWTLNAFISSLYAAGILVFLTAAGPLNMDDQAVWALDLWLVIVGGLALWGIHAAPPGLRRSWFALQLSVCMLLAMIFGWWTTLGALDMDDTAAALFIGVLGAAGIVYGLRFDARDTIIASCITLLTAAWYFGTEAGGAFGAVLALAFSAILFFWISTRLGRSRTAD